MILLIMYKHHVECWTHWLWIWLTVGRAPGVKAGSRAALLPGVGILYIYIFIWYTYVTYSIYGNIEYILHIYTYLHVYGLKKWSFECAFIHPFDVPGQRMDSLRFFSWMQHVQALELVIPSVAQCLCVLQGYQDISSFGHVFLTPTFWCWFVK